MVSAREIAEDVGVESEFVKKRKRNRRFDNESEDQSSELSQESQFKVNFFLHLVGHAIASLNDRFEQTHFVNEIFNSLLSQKKLLQAFNENYIHDACKTFHDKLGDIWNVLYIPSTKVKKVLKQQEIFLIISVKINY